jgi:hypothetical protein
VRAWEDDVLAAEAVLEAGAGGSAVGVADEVVGVEGEVLGVADAERVVGGEDEEGDSRAAGADGQPVGVEGGGETLGEGEGAQGQTVELDAAAAAAAAAADAVAIASAPAPAAADDHAETWRWGQDGGMVNPGRLAWMEPTRAQQAELMEPGWRWTGWRWMWSPRSVGER